MSPARQKRGGPPKPCRACAGERVVAWTKPRVDFCYQCLPGGPFTPPACRGCGGSDYYSQGLCTRCHHYAPQHVDSCLDCQAWGVIRKYKWLCWRCTHWRARFPRGTCRFCARENLPVNPDQQCNLCDRQTFIVLGATAEEANADGQQLYLANVAWVPTRRRHGGVRRPKRPARRRRRPGSPLEPVVFYPVGESQLTLFDMPRDLPAAQRKGPFPDPPNQQMAAFLDYQVLDHARRHGWPTSAVKRTRLAMRVLQTLQETPGAMLLASDAMLLQSIELPAINVIDVATAAGVMLDDRQPAIHSWFATTIAELPAPMRAELAEWFDVMLHGSTTPPRRRPRSEQTTRLHLRWAMPALTTWSAAGHQSLREITTAQVRVILPPAGNPRSTMGSGLRSILTVLKARKTLFLNPIARIVTGSHERRQPLPLDTAVVVHALNSPNPACAALAALAAFHGLRSGELRHVHLTSVADGRLRIGDRSIPLAEPVRVRLSAWLDYRAQRWPNTANPYLFINHRNAGRLTPVGLHWLGLTLGLPVKVIRDDRILDEVDASNGDIRRICDLFGLSVTAAERYTATVDNPDLITNP